MNCQSPSSSDGRAMRRAADARPRCPPEGGGRGRSAAASGRTPRQPLTLLEPRQVVHRDDYRLSLVVAGQLDALAARAFVDNASELLASNRGRDSEYHVFQGWACLGWVKWTSRYFGSSHQSTALATAPGTDQLPGKLRRKYPSPLTWPWDAYVVQECYVRS